MGSLGVKGREAGETGDGWGDSFPRERVATESWGFPFGLAELLPWGEYEIDSSLKYFSAFSEGK